jgi:hypothetical protein
MRALIIGPDEKAAIRKVVAYAMEPDHFFRDGGSPPGSDPNFVAHIPDGFRCVFTFTRHQGKLFRHLTVSVNGPLLPSPEAGVMLAKEFGFTASDDSLDVVLRMQNDGWLASPGHEGEHCVMLAQPV